jgi:hypothetical protein
MEEVALIEIGRRSRKLHLGLLLALVAIGCSTATDAPGPVVLEIQGRKVGLEEVRWAYDHQDSLGAFDAATPEKRSDFLKTIGDKEVLLALAREQSPDLSGHLAIELREKNETALLKAVENKVVGPIQRDSVAAHYLDRFRRQINLMGFITPSDSLAKLAHAEVVAGTPFADVVMKYCKDTEVLARKGNIGWKTPEIFGREFAMELWIDERAPGYLSEVRRTPSGVVFYQVLGVREPDGSTVNPASEKLLPQLAQAIRAYNGMMAHLDSLRHANGFEIIGENIPVLMKGMNAYWDSLAAASRATGAAPKFFNPPLSRFSAEERALPLYKLRNKSVTIAEFVQGLSEFSPKRWPMGPDMEAAQKQIDARIIWQLQLDEARELGFDRSMDYVMTARLEEEKLRLGDYVAGTVAKGITVTPEATREYYDENLDRYRTKEAIAFSYVIFPDKAEATRFQQEANTKDLNWWGDRLAEFQKKRPDLIVRLNTPQYDPSKEVPDTVRAAVKAAWNSRVSEVTAPQPTVGGRWIVPRTTYRSHEGIMPLEKVVASVETTLKDQELTRRIDKLVQDGSARFGLKLYPERLEKKG